MQAYLGFGLSLLIRWNWLKGLICWHIPQRLWSLGIFSYLFDDE